MTNARVLEALAFGLVGASATAVYFGVAIMVYAIPPFDAPASAFLASVSSVLWSYAGHHHFTFRKTGSHHFYLPRFVGISVMLSAIGRPSVDPARNSPKRMKPPQPKLRIGQSARGKYSLSADVVSREW